MRILGIDPGPKESGVCLISDGNLQYVKKVDEHEIKRKIKLLELCGHFEIAVEGMVCMGQVLGQSSIETCYLVGRIQEFAARHSAAVTLYSRREYGRWYVPDGTLNDASLRAALEQMYGPSQKKGDPLYALRGASDKRSAFALAKYHEFKLENPSVAAAPLGSGR